jgi:hypothetical protein
VNSSLKLGLKKEEPNITMMGIEGSSRWTDATLRSCTAKMIREVDEDGYVIAPRGNWSQRELPCDGGRMFKVRPTRPSQERNERDVFDPPRTTWDN